MKAIDSDSLLKSRLHAVAPAKLGGLAHALGPAMAAALSGVLLFAGFPPYNLPLLSWFALIPLLRAIEGKRSGQSFLLALWTGIVFILGVFNYHWIFDIHFDNNWQHAILAAYYVVYVGYSAAYVGAFGLCFSRISRRFGLFVALLAAPFFWVALEFLRSNMFFLAFPWALLAHSQYQVTPVIQVSSVTGAYGVSFLIVLVNCALFALLFPFLGSGKNGSSFQLAMSALERRGLVFLASATVAATLVYGYLSMVDRWAGRSIGVAALQGNIEQNRKWDQKYSRSIMDTYDRLTHEAASGKPDLIVWPESATPSYLESNPGLYRVVKSLAKEVRTNLLIGTSGTPKFQRGDTASQSGVNSMVLIRPDTGFGKELKYDKIRLLPFGEYLPLENVIPWSYIGVPTPALSISGKETTLLSTPDFRFGAPICWENVFPDLIRGFVKAGGQFIVNSTNEAWFGKTPVPYHFLSMSVFRAVENRRFMVRCANTGISCVIDPCGRVVDRVRDAEGRDIFVTGIVSARITCLDSLTIYTRCGDWPAAASLICSAALFLASLRRGRIQASPHGGVF
ncbi:MAG: apolipoprotein N-acyltransferase [Syntrophobacteraceae bacterium]